MTTWRIDTPAQTIALATYGGIPEVTYWGPRLPDTEDLLQLAAAARLDLTGGMIDQLPALSLCPESGRAFSGQPGLVVSDAHGTPLHPVFTFDRAEVAPGSLRLISRAGGITLTHVLTAQATGVILLQTLLDSDAPLRVQWLAAPVLPAPQQGHMLDVSGKWTREFHLNRTDWTPGVRLREARTGRSGHEHPPYLILTGDGCTNSAGFAQALHYAWSGGHRMVAEELPCGRRQVQFGHASGAETQLAKQFATAEVVAVTSTQGLNGIAATFQRDIRDR
ncbi:MAG: alpha-galactosidase, partial [Rhodobacteraceae bacterium PARR1]